MGEPVVPVDFVCNFDPGQRVELIGDFPDWAHGVVMREERPGEYRCELVVEPGIYRYKFRGNHRRWFCDPRAVGRDYAEGYENSLLIVGGTRPPLYFAPDRRHLVLTETGELLVHLEVDEGVPLPSHVWVQTSTPAAGSVGPSAPPAGANVGAGVSAARRSSSYYMDPGEAPTHTAPLELVMRHRGRLALRGRIALGPEAARAGGYFGFLGYPEYVFALPRSRTAAGLPPAWYDRGVYYAIFLDRWHRGRNSSRFERAVRRDATSTREVFYGGDLDGVAESVDYIAGLGASGIVLTPIHLSPTPHRYDTIDFETIAPELGGEAALERLIVAAHAKGLKVIVDVAVTHVNEGHPAFLDVLANQEQSPFASWFRIKRFPVVLRDTQTFECYPQRVDLPWLNLRPGPAREHVLAAMEKLVRSGVDGVRLDAVNDAPLDFWRELRARGRAINPELLLLGEIVMDSAPMLAEERGVDIATDFPHREHVIAFFGRSPKTEQRALYAPKQIDALTFWQNTSFARFRQGPFDPSFHVLFLDNHDTPRFLSLTDGLERLHLALTYLYVRPEPIWLTYGTELALTCGHPECRFEDAWPERMPMPPCVLDSCATQKLVTELARLRRQLPELASTELRVVRASGHLLVIERGPVAAPLRAYFNAGEHSVPLDDVPSGFETVLAVNEQPSSPGAPLAGRAARLLRRAARG